MKTKAELETELHTKMGMGIGRAIVPAGTAWYENQIARMKSLIILQHNHIVALEKSKYDLAAEQISSKGWQLLCVLELVIILLLIFV